MKLRKVIYRVFGREKDGPWATEPSSWHQLDGEVLLVLHDRESAYISWGNEPEQYCIQLKNRSFFSPGTLKEIDVSDHPYWRELVGRSLRYGFKDAQHQVLEITTGGASVFLSSQYDDGIFSGDCVRVSNVQPPL